MKSRQNTITSTPELLTNQRKTQKWANKVINKLSKSENMLIIRKYMLNGQIEVYMIAYQQNRINCYPIFLRAIYMSQDKIERTNNGTIHDDITEKD